uniref:PRKC apoptosis WT1 regulator protein-like n=1 Tax=Ciona intestinalis TaxID=7719 RepID=F6U1G9_CIOIN|nr:PRKC apoptosis WT1 regulator protein-like [Ciona intestinalis]|eukprot:XP_002130071.1 PRKC apoptosis WT1 regulator protein-like [Ciona intestinalis]
MFHPNRPSEDDRPRSSRRYRTSRSRDLDYEVNSNGNNSVAMDNDAKGSVRDAMKTPQRNTTSANRSPLPRRKSTLIETMTANFERKNTEIVVTSAPVKVRSNQNGDVKQSEPPVQTEQTDTSTSPQEKKSGPSARRGKQQREKRMLRQKRRSTGVVSLKDIQNEADNSGDVEKQKVNADETETVKNTQSNEFSPPSDSTVSRFNLNVSDLQLHGSGVDTKNEHGCSRCQSENEASKAIGSKNSEIKTLQRKLEDAEFTIAKLRKELKTMDNEMHQLENENQQLKKDNKMLDDENKTMLRLIRRP